MGVVQQKKDPADLLAQLTQVFLDCHGDIQATTEFGNFLTGDPRSATAFASALHHTRVDLRQHRSITWLDEASSQVSRSSQQVTEDLEFALQELAPVDDGLELAKTRPRSDRHSGSDEAGASRRRQPSSVFGAGASLGVHGARGVSAGAGAAAPVPPLSRREAGKRAQGSAGVEEPEDSDARPLLPRSARLAPATPAKNKAKGPQGDVAARDVAGSSARASGRGRRERGVQTFERGVANNLPACIRLDV